MAVIELVKFTASEAFINDQSSGKELYDLIKSADGCLALYYGLQQEDPGVGIITIVWETYEHHQKLIEAPHYSKVQDSAKPLISVGDFEIQHVPVDVDPTAAVTAPVTEFGYLKPKEGKDKECLDILHTSSDALSTAKGVRLPPAWGEIREDAGKYHVFVGWESLEAHAAAGVGEMKLFVDKILAAFDVTVVHVKLVEHL